MCHPNPGSQRLLFPVRVPQEFFHPPERVDLRRIKDAMRAHHRDRGIPMVEKAYHLTAELVDRKEQKDGKQFLRASGTPQIDHYRRVCYRNALLGGNGTLVTIGLTHDWQEDLDRSKEYIEERFGPRVANNVAVLSKQKWDLAGGGGWVFADDPRYPQVPELPDEVRDSMRFARSRLHHDTIYTFGDIYAFVTKGDDALDNLWHPSRKKQKEHGEQSINNLLGLVLRMLGPEDVEVLLGMIRKAGLVVPPHLIMPSDSYVHLCGHRDVLLRNGLDGMVSGMQMPRVGQFNIYGTVDTILALDYCEVGVQRGMWNCLPLFVEKFPSLKVTHGKSKLPVGHPGSEEIIVFSSFNPNRAADSFRFSLNRKTKRVHISLKGSRLFRIPLHQLNPDFWEHPRLLELRKEVKRKFDEFVAGVQQIHEEHFMPRIRELLDAQGGELTAKPDGNPALV